MVIPERDGWDTLKYGHVWWIILIIFFLHFSLLNYFLMQHTSSTLLIKAKTYKITKTILKSLDIHPLFSSGMVAIIKLEEMTLFTPYL